DVEAGEVSSVARESPWGLLDQYDEWLDGCRPVHDREAVSAERKPPLNGRPISHFNNEDYMPPSPPTTGPRKPPSPWPAGPRAASPTSACRRWPCPTCPPRSVHPPPGSTT